MSVYQRRATNNTDTDFTELDCLQKQANVLIIAPFDIPPDKAYRTVELEFDISSYGVMLQQLTSFTLIILDLKINTVYPITDHETNRVSMSFTVPTTFKKETLDISVLATDEYGFTRLETKTIQVFDEPHILAPEIIAPENNTSIYEEIVSVVASDFTMLGEQIDESHITTEYRVTSDPEGNNILLLIDNVTEAHDLTRYNIPTDCMPIGETVYLFVRYEGKVLGWSDWSPPRAVIHKSKLVLPSGRKIYRHISDKGSVLEFTDGTVRRVLVLDACYRFMAKWGTYSTQAQKLNYNIANTKNTQYIDGTDTDMDTDRMYPQTDADLNTLWRYSIDKNTARQNDTVWMTYQNNPDYKDPFGTRGVPAVAGCRQIEVPNYGFADVPNIQTLIRIFIEADHIDDLDPTIGDYPTFALGRANSNGYWIFDTGINGTDREAWSSTEASKTAMRLVSNKGFAGNNMKHSVRAVIPIIEV